MKRQNFIVEFTTNGNKQKRSYTTFKTAEKDAKYLMHKLTKDNDAFVCTIEQQGGNSLPITILGRNDNGFVTYHYE